MLLTGTQLERCRHILTAFRSQRRHHLMHADGLLKCRGLSLLRHAADRNFKFKIRSLRRSVINVTRQHQASRLGWLLRGALLPVLES